MSHLALYRKYRPQNFANIIGQEHIVKTLTNAIKYDLVNHAYIFYGPRGIGKTSIAKIFAKALNCLNPKDGDACLECENCLALRNNDAIDVVELDAASNNGVDDIRIMLDNIQYLPTNLKYKVYIIDEAHMLTKQAWNALLKTVEEAPKHAIFIFATTEVRLIPLTILSRCQTFNFHRFLDSDIKTLLNMVIANEGINIEPEAINKVIQLANGAARDALTILDQLVSSTQDIITTTIIDSLFSLVDEEKKQSFITSMLSLNTEKCLDLLVNFIRDGISLSNLTNDILNIFMDYLVYCETKNLKFIKTNVSFLNSITLSQPIMLNILDIWNSEYKTLINSSNQYYSYEVVILKTIQAIKNSGSHTIQNNNVKVSQPLQANKPVEAPIIKQVIEKPIPAPQPPKPIAPQPVYQPPKPQVVQPQQLSIQNVVKPQAVQQSTPVQVPQPIVKPSIPITNIQPKKDNTVVIKVEPVISKPITIEKPSSPVFAPVYNISPFKRSSEFDIDEIAYTIIKEYKKSQNIVMSKYLDEIKHNISLQLVSGPILTFNFIKQVVFASDTGCVFLVDDKIDVEYFNNISFSEQFISDYKKITNEKRYLIALDKETLTAIIGDIRKNGSDGMNKFIWNYNGKNIIKTIMLDINKLNELKTPSANDIAKKYGI